MKALPAVTKNDKMFAAAKIGKLKAPGRKSNKLGAMKISKEKLNLSRSSEVILLPPPRPRQLKVQIENNNNSTITKRSLEQRVILGTQALLGKVEFCLSMHKKFQPTDAIWDVYGKVINIKQAPNSDECILLLRNENSGPIMQAICKRTDEKLKEIEKGCYVRVVGRFVGINRFFVYCVDKIVDEIWNHSFVELHDMVENTLKSLKN